MWWEPANQGGTIVGMGSFLCLGVILIVAFLTSGTAPVQASNPTFPPREQVPGHISGNDVRDGITTVDLTVHGEKVTCIYMVWDGSYAGGPAITCDWQHQR